MMTGRGEIRTQNHVGYRLKGQRGRKKERNTWWITKKCWLGKGKARVYNHCNSGRWKHLWRCDEIYCILLTLNKVGQVSCGSCTSCSGNWIENRTQTHDKLNGLTLTSTHKSVCVCVCVYIYIYIYIYMFVVCFLGVTTLWLYLPQPRSGFQPPHFRGF
jgi:hypothetical protein